MADPALDEAMKSYPYLKDKKINAMRTIDPFERRVLEFWNETEPGDEKHQRPKELPLGQVGVQLFNNAANPLDILGDYVSHHAVKADPKLKDIYSRFAQSVPSKTMQDRYYYHQRNMGERRPYEQWLELSGLPEYFRGYTFNQWPNAKGMYGPEQLRIMDEAREYLGIK